MKKGLWPVVSCLLSILLVGLLAGCRKTPATATPIATLFATATPILVEGVVKQPLGPTITPNRAGQTPELATPELPQGYLFPPQVVLSVLLFVNPTDQAVMITLSGMDERLELPAHGRLMRQLAPGSYTYQAARDDSGEVISQGEITLKNHTLHTLTLGGGAVIQATEGAGAMAEVTITNGVGCELTIKLQGPETLTVTIPIDGVQVITLPVGIYQYTAEACGASLAGEKEFRGQQTWDFSLDQGGG